MKKFIVAAMALALSSSVTFAASTTYRTYPTARAAALYGGAYRLDKAAWHGRVRASSLKITKAIDTTGPNQKFQVSSKTTLHDGKPAKQITVTVKKLGPAKYKAYLPNRSHYTSNLSINTPAELGIIFNPDGSINRNYGYTNYYE